tara:strand:- start:965 stop:2242 length:1278 start_codon:yes stop_codon:yes gene_type:complete
MAEGVESLADPDDLEMARQASEAMANIEMQMEYDKELPPAFRAGGQYSLFSDLGRSVPNLQYHTFGTVPERFREEFEATRPAREARLRIAQDYGVLDRLEDINTVDMDVGYPFHTMSGSAGSPLLGLYMAKPTTREEQENQKFREKYGLGKSSRSSLTFRKGYRSPEDAEILVGQGLASLPDAKIFFDDLEKGETAPGFLSGPTRPSVNMKLSEVLIGEPTYRKTRASTFQHELVHAGVRHPRFKEFLKTRFFKELPISTRVKFSTLADMDHLYIDDMDRYKDEYQKAIKDGTVAEGLREGPALLPQALEKIQADSDAGKVDEDFERRTFTLQRMLQDVEQGNDPVDTYVKGIALDADERRRLSDLEEMSLIFGSFLNRTADSERGRQFYTGVEALKQADEFGLVPERFMSDELSELDVPIKTAK